MSEQAQVEAAKTNFAAFAELYENYFDRIYSYVYGILGNHAACEDVVSICFEKAMTKLHTYEDQGFSFGAWLYRIARNSAYDYIKKESCSIDGVDEVIARQPAEARTADQAEAELEASELRQHLDTLPANYREVLEVRYVQGYSIAETAELVGKTEDSIKSITKRAIKKLRTKLIEPELDGAR